MSKLDRQFYEDRAMRDAAREVLKADITHARTSLSAKGLATRVGGRIGDGAADVYEVAKVHAGDKRGLIAMVVGALVLWLGRDTILEAFRDLERDSNPDDEASEAETPETAQHTPSDHAPIPEETTE